MKSSLLPITPEAWNFHPTRNNVILDGLNLQVDGSLSSNLAGLNPDVTTWRESSLAESLVTKGHEALLIRIEGVPINTECLEIKYVYHLEGTPAIVDSTVLLPATPPLI